MKKRRLFAIGMFLVSISFQGWSSAVSSDTKDICEHVLRPFPAWLAQTQPEDFLSFQACVDSCDRSHRVLKIWDKPLNQINRTEIECVRLSFSILNTLTNDEKLLIDYLDFIDAVLPYPSCYSSAESLKMTGIFKDYEATLNRNLFASLIDGENLRVKLKTSLPCDGIPQLFDLIQFRYNLRCYISKFYGVVFTPDIYNLDWVEFPSPKIKGDYPAMGDEIAAFVGFLKALKMTPQEKLNLDVPLLDSLVHHTFIQDGLAHQNLLFSKPLKDILTYVYHLWVMPAEAFLICVCPDLSKIKGRKMRGKISHPIYKELQQHFEPQKQKVFVWSSSYSISFALVQTSVSLKKLREAVTEALA